MRKFLAACRSAALNERGGVQFIVLLVGILVLALPLILVIIDRQYVLTLDEKSHMVIDELNRDTYSFLDVTYTADTTGFQITDKTAANELFMELLKRRFKLNDSLQPIDDSLLDRSGAVTVVQWRVVDESEVPVYDGYSRTMQFPGVITEVLLPFRTPMLGIRGELRKLVTTEIYR